MAHSTEKVEAVIPQQFPAGVRVLVVDNDTTLLNAIQQMCTRCRYRVTTCSQALVALNLLRKREACFDVILIDVHIPDMDGYDFLQCASQELKIPVIIMSVDATTSAVMKAIKHGACDYWIKPLHEEQFRNMWQHVARKTLSENKPHEIIDEGQIKRGKDDSSEGEDKDYYPPPTKKARVAWSPELHQEFVRAVTQLGFEKAVPKRILEVMNVPGLTREHVASHLQKFRLRLKKTIEEKQPQNGMSKAISMMGGSRGFDFPAFATTSHVPLETMAAGLQVPKEDQSAIMKSSCIQWPNPSHAEHTMAYGNPQVSNIVACRNNFPQSNNMILDGSSSSRYGAFHPPNVLMNALPLQQHQQPLMNLVQFNSFNNCMVVSGASEEGNINQASFNQNSGFVRNNSLNSNNPFGVPQHYFGFNPPTGLEIESSVSDFGSGKVSSDIDNINTRGEEPDSIINSSEEDHPFA